MIFVKKKILFQDLQDYTADFCMAVEQRAFLTRPFPKPAHSEKVASFLWSLDV